MEPISEDELKGLIKEAEAQAYELEKAGQDNSSLQLRIKKLRKTIQSGAFLTEAKPTGGIASEKTERGEDIIISTGPVRREDFNE